MIIDFGANEIDVDLGTLDQHFNVELPNVPSHVREAFKYCAKMMMTYLPEEHRQASVQNIVDQLVAMNGLFTVQ